MTDNKKKIDEFTKYSEEDWKFYKGLRDGAGTTPKRLTIFSGASGNFFNEPDGGDGLHILAPTQELLNKANEERDWNDSSYVILYRVNGRKILFCGDAHDDTWEHILENHKSSVENIDLLIAPHHGRDSNMNFEFLDTLKPSLTLFGNAKSEHLAYDKWSSRGFKYVTNNQAGNIVLDPDGKYFSVFVSNRTFAEAYASSQGFVTFHSPGHMGWYLTML